jgi:hypothetical protein
VSRQARRQQQQQQQQEEQQQRQHQQDPREHIHPRENNATVCVLN